MTSAPLVAENNSYLVRFLFALFAVFVLARIFIGANVVDLFENYTAEQGSFFEKIHPANFGIAAVAVVAMLSLRIELAAWELRIVRAYLWLLAFMAVVYVLMAQSGRSSSAGYLVDGYGFACIASALLFAFPRAWRESLANIILVLLVVSALIAIGEFVTKHRLLPYRGQELTFRPTGLLEHPLTIGVCSGMAIAFVAASGWRPINKFLATVVLLIGVFAAGARLGSIVAGLVVLAIVLSAQFPPLSPQRRMQLKIIIVTATVLAMPITIASLIALGLTDRFEHGLFDESAMARVSIYRVFDLVSWRDILLGSDVGEVRKLAAERFQLEFIESPFVIFIFHFGLIGAVVFVFFLVRTVIALLAGAQRFVVMGTLAFFIVALGNNTLSSKTQTLTLLFVLIIALHPAPSVPGVARLRG